VVVEGAGSSVNTRVVYKQLEDNPQHLNCHNHGLLLMSSNTPCWLSLQDDDKALHKCHQEEKKFDRLRGPLLDAERPTGFCSSITVGSMLPFKTAIMKGSVVELLARRGRLEILVQNPPDGQELYWHNTRTVPKPYKGPREVRFEQDFLPHHDVKLALTSWAHGAFDVLHPAPGSRLLGKSMQRAWERPVDPWHAGSSSNAGSSSEDDDDKGGDAGSSRHVARHNRALQGSPLQLQEQQQNAAAEPADADAVGEAALHQQQQQQQQAQQQQLQRRQQLLQELMQQQQQQQPAAPSAPEAGAGSSSAAAAATTAAAAVVGAGSSGAAAAGAAAAAGLIVPAAAAEAGASPASEESANSRDGQLMA
jgi:hypothetical protein